MTPVTPRDDGTFSAVDHEIVNASARKSLGSAVQRVAFADAAQINLYIRIRELHRAPFLI